MKKIFKVREWEDYIKVIVVGTAVVLVMVAVGIFKQASKSAELVIKQQIFTIPVNSELDTDPRTYVSGIESSNEAKINFDGVDITKVGTYEGVIAYDGTDYKIKFNVVDEEKPVLTLNGNGLFEYKLDATVDEVNTEINSYLSISDNYDTTFEPISVITEMPTEEQEIEVSLTVKDSSGNESDPVTVHIKFLPVEEETPETNTNTNNGYYHGGNSGGNNNGGGTSGGDSGSGSSGGNEGNNGENQGGSDGDGGDKGDSGDNGGSGEQDPPVTDPSGEGEDTPTE